MGHGAEGASRQNRSSVPVPGQLCVLDLDGTLVDSLKDIADSLNYALDLLGLPQLAVEDCRYMVGEGVPMLAQRAIGAAHPELVARLGELVRAVYRTRVTRHTRPYAGVPELVERFRRRGLKLGVLSNKPHDMTVRVVKAFWPDGTFDAVYGYVNEEHRKPSPYYLHKICDEVGVRSAQTCMIGDTPTDVATALAAGAVPIGVTWGFRTRPELEAAGAVRIVDSPEELG